MCRIGFGVDLIGLVALFLQRRSNFCSVLFRQIEGSFDPWLAGFRHGAQGRVSALGRQLPPDEGIAGREMEGRLPLGVEWGSQAKDKPREEEINLRGCQPISVLPL